MTAAQMSLLNFATTYYNVKNLRHFYSIILFIFVALSEINLVLRGGCKLIKH